MCVPTQSTTKWWEPRNTLIHHETVRPCMAPWGFRYATAAISAFKMTHSDMAMSDAFVCALWRWLPDDTHTQAQAAEELQHDCPRREHPKIQHRHHATTAMYLHGDGPAIAVAGEFSSSTMSPQYTPLHC
eukprot:TRINITY_DN1847_c0_g1_i11.p1 TRINITY_DN1847_c0_g1~~TRINITY_DN1847_c0_g1_i11.p1  ORF type:complete len:130 (+),score=9.34 TRINITY_DN1847_c0_g1_i11:745-1134(+)